MKKLDIINEFENLDIISAVIEIDRVNDYESELARDCIYETIMTISVRRSNINAVLEYDLHNGVNLSGVKTSVVRTAPPMRSGIKLGDRPRATLADIELSDIFAEIAENLNKIEELYNNAK